MPPKKPRPAPDHDGLPTTDHMDRLCAAVERLADEMKLIRELVDRVLDDFSWAINNDRLRPDCCPNLSALADRAMELEAADATDVRHHEATPTAREPVIPEPDFKPCAEQRDLFS